MSGFVCGPKCWTPIDCPDHGNRMDPWGRSSPMGVHICCDNRDNSKINPRHLWDEHDPDRHYHDPKGWADHEKNCKQCSPEEDDD